MGDKSSKHVKIIFGRNPVKEALRAKQINCIFVSDSLKDNNLINLITTSKIQYKIVKNGDLDYLTNSKNHQGIAAEIKEYTYVSVEEVINKAKKNPHPVIVLLDGINDPQNMGTILRSCDVFNVGGVIVPKHNQVPLNATVAKTSAGAINYVSVAQCTNMNQTLQKLKDEGFWIVASDGSAKQSFREINYDFPTALIIGSEGYGISKLLLENSDYVIKIPEHGHINSLNASVAAGILLSEICK